MSAKKNSATVLPRKRKTRAALGLAPTYNEVNDVQDAYVDTLDLRRLAKMTGRYWAFHRIPTTVALPGNRFAKSLRAFTDHTTEDSFRELLREYRDLGVARPGGYADVFHQRFRSPHICWSVNALLAPAFAGGWQEAIDVGYFPGVYRKYDMRSAYLWAVTLGLPDTRTYTHSMQPWKKEGVYRIRLQQTCDTAPFPFNRTRNVLASTQEIDTYGLRIEEVLDGIAWRNVIEPTEILDKISLVSTWKQAARCFWGRWAQVARVQCVSGAKRWELPNLALNVPWAHMVISRVKMRLWEFSSDAKHVYVDSVITPRELPTGPNIGDWKLEKTYKHGVLVRETGQYGDATELRLERMAGVAHDSALRVM